jgi:hypothetical protein
MFRILKWFAPISALGSISLVLRQKSEFEKFKDYGNHDAAKVFHFASRRLEMEFDSHQD